MYLNRAYSTMAQYNKGLQGEFIYESWLIDHNIPFRRATKEEDYTLKHDFYITREKEYSIAVKNNYNGDCNTVVVEMKQLMTPVESFPKAWIDHDVDYIAFIVNDEVYHVKQSVLKIWMTVNGWKFKTYDRAQSRFKGSYRIDFVPLPDLMDIITKKTELVY